MEKTCKTCGKPLKRLAPSQRQPQFCSHACYSQSMAGKLKNANPKGTRMQRAKGHPLAPPSGTVATCRLVLYDKIGPGPHPCEWCRTQLEWMPGKGITAGAIVADHLNWDHHDNSPENLVPSCQVCNSHRTRNHDRRRISVGELVTMIGGSRTRAVERTCETCGTPFLGIPAAIKNGHARYCSPSCAYTARRGRPRSSKRGEVSKDHQD